MYRDPRERGVEKKRPLRDREANLWAVRLARSQAINDQGGSKAARGQATAREWALTVSSALGSLSSSFIGQWGWWLPAALVLGAMVRLIIVQ